MSQIINIPYKPKPKHKIPKTPPKGYHKIKERTTHGQPIYTDNKYFISPDVDQHNGGWWKKAKSIKKLEIRGKGGRLGTFNEDLSIRLGD